MHSGKLKIDLGIPVRFDDELKMKAGRLQQLRNVDGSWGHGRKPGEDHGFCRE